MFHKTPTSQQKKDINALLSRFGSIAKRLETVDSIDKYFTEWDKYLVEYRKLEAYENMRIKFSISPKKLHAQILNEVPRLEHNVVERGYDRMLRDAVKLSTESGKKKKAENFFNELEFYYSRLQPQTVEYIEELKWNCPYMDRKQSMDMNVEVVTSAE